MIFFSVTVSGIPSTETLLTSSLVVCQLNAWLMQTLVKCGWKIGYILRTSGKEADETCSLGLQVIGTTSYGFKIWHLLLHGNRGDGGTDHAASHKFFFLSSQLSCVAGTVTLLCRTFEWLHWFSSLHPLLTLACFWAFLQPHKGYSEQKSKYWLLHWWLKVLHFFYFKS
jgi:hypothetical protein